MGQPLLLLFLILQKTEFQFIKTFYSYYFLIYLYNQPANIDMSSIKVLVVEDELIIAEDMKAMLGELEYEVTGIARDIKTAEENLSIELPDIVLVDIQLRNNDNGINLGKTIKEKYNIPIVFVTSHSDKTTLDKAKLINPEGYIVKPFEKADLYTSIELGIFNYTSRKKTESEPVENIVDNIVFKDSIFIRKDYMLVKIKFDDLKWIQSDDNYLELFCTDNKHLIRSTLKDFLEKLPSATFLQVHKSYCVNVKFITAINRTSVWINKVEIPVGRSYIENISKVLKLEL
jgi:two-component system response regulator LytT